MQRRAAQAMEALETATPALCASLTGSMASYEISDLQEAIHNAKGLQGVDQDKVVLAEMLLNVATEGVVRSVCTIGPHRIFGACWTTVRRSYEGGTPQARLYG